MSYRAQSANSKFYWAAIAVICGYMIGAYDKSHSFLVLQKLGASVTAIHLMVSAMVLFYTITVLKLIKQRAQLSLSSFGEALQDISDQASSEITEGITGLQELAEQIKAEVDALNMRDVHDKLGRIAQSIQIAAAKPQQALVQKRPQKSDDAPRQSETPRNETIERSRSDAQVREKKTQPKTKDASTAQQIVSHETAKQSALPEKPTTPAPAPSKAFRPEPQPPIKPGVNKETFLGY